MKQVTHSRKFFMPSSLQNHHSMQLPAKADALIKWRSMDDVKNTLSSDKFKADSPYLILGEGSNVVFLNDFPGTVILNQLKGCEVIEKTNDHVILDVAAGQSWHELVMRCNEWTYSGIENLALIPGTVGAAPVQNIGAYGTEFSNVCESVSVISCQTGEVSVLSNAECEFGYRSSCFKQDKWKDYVIVSVRLRLRCQNHQWNLSYEPLKKALLAYRSDQLTGDLISQAVIAIRQSRLPDPKALPNAGSFFKNPVISDERLAELLKEDSSLPHYPQPNGEKLSAAYLIQACGLKGQSDNGVGTFSKHALVVVHHGDADGQVFWHFIQKIRQSVQKRFGMSLELEVRCYDQGNLVSPSCATDWYFA